MEECKRRKELGLPEVYLYEKDTKQINYTDFVNKELVLFSNLDNERSIPCLVDGLKPGQRKVFIILLKVLFSMKIIFENISSILIYMLRLKVQLLELILLLILFFVGTKFHT